MYRIFKVSGDIRQPWSWSDIAQWPSDIEFSERRGNTVQTPCAKSSTISYSFNNMQTFGNIEEGNSFETNCGCNILSIYTNIKKLSAQKN